MQYRKDKHGNNISLLGYGCMRFTTKGGHIDKEKAEQEILFAYQHGVNYFDTAYIYPGSEAALGYILEKNNIRENVYISTKLPQYLVSNKKAIDTYFSEQLARLRTSYVDYYFMHHLTDISAWENLQKNGILEWIAQKKAVGAIKNIGFSFHGNTDMFSKILNDYDWDICLVQYNYLDETSQAGKAGVQEAFSKHIPVVIMEPLRGGKLVSLLPKTAKTLMQNSSRAWSPAEWAFRWLFDQKEITCVLSGMNSVEMVAENCRIADTAHIGDFSTEDRALIEKVKTEIQAKTKVPCTACRYCMPCPKHVDIPAIFKCYNTLFTENAFSARAEFAQTVGFRKETAFASQCVQCGKCETHCPQQIAIRQELKKAEKALRPLPYKIAIAFLRHFMVR